MKSISQPTIFVENKTDYAKTIINDQFNGFKVLKKNAGSYNQNIVLSLFPEETADILIITYGGNVELALKAAEEVYLRDETLINILVPSSIRPIHEEFILDEVKKCGKVIVLEEGNKIGGWGAEVISIIQQRLEYLDCSIKRLGSEDLPIPSSGLMELEVLPSVDKIINTVNSINV